MIKISYKYKNNIVDYVLIKGHALYAESGKDIVCSAVSTMVTTTINNILALDNNAIEYEANKGYVKIINKDNKTSSKLLQVMINMLKELKDNYPKNISIEEEK